MTDPEDIAARRRIQTDFAATFFVEAAAGTGKTTALVGRIVGLIRAGAGRLEQIVAVTFTEPAVGEMLPVPEQPTRLCSAMAPPNGDHTALPGAALSW